MIKKTYIKKILYYLLLAAIVVVVFLPIYYLLITTFKSPAEAAASPLSLPKHITFQNYVEAVKAMGYGQALLNNLIIVVVSVVGLVVLASMAAYVVARSRKRAFKLMNSIFMIGLIIPFQISIIPIYRILSAVDLVNTHLGVILVDIFCINLPLSIFLISGFVNTIPLELEEAALIDGCGPFRCFWRIIFPLLKPVVATVIILDALAIWNDFLTPLLLLQSQCKQVLLQRVYMNVGPFSTNWTAFFPMLVMATLPIVMFYLIMRKRIIEGVVAGAIKG